MSKSSKNELWGAIGGGLGNLLGPKMIKKRPHVISVPLLGLCLDPQWDSKISKNRFLRRLKIRFGKAHENQSQKGDFFRSLTCLNCVRGVQNQGFDVFTNSSNMEPKLARFGGQFGLPKRPKAFKRRLMFWGTISGVKKVTRRAPREMGAGLGGP